MKKKLLTFSVAAISSLALAGCGNKNKGEYDNDVDSVIFSTQEVDGVFNPFFSTTATDGNVTGLTQISMLSNDKDGKPLYGYD